MGRTFQISNVCTDLTVIENLLLAMLGTDRRKWIMHRPLPRSPDLRERGAIGLSRVGLDGRADETVKFLSYGERRQLELALALASDPKVAAARRAVRGPLAERAAALLAARSRDCRATSR